MELELILELIDYFSKSGDAMLSNMRSKNSVRRTDKET